MGAEGGQHEASQSAVDDVRSLFARAGLPFPPIPEEWLMGMQRRGEWVYSTEPLPPSGNSIHSPYNIFHYVEDAARRRVSDYVLLAHAGRGSNSYAIHVYVVHGLLMLFLQLEWGGVYMNRDQTIARIAQCFEAAGSLIAEVREAEHAGKFASGRRLLVVESDFSGGFWTWLDSPAANRAEVQRLWDERETAGRHEAVVVQAARQEVRGLWAD